MQAFGWTDCGKQWKTSFKICIFLAEIVMRYISKVSLLEATCLVLNGVIVMYILHLCVAGQGPTHVVHSSVLTVATD